MTTRQDAAEQIVKELYGGSLYGQGRGYYVTLELLAITWGSTRANETALSSPGDPIRFARRSHDFARRMLYDTSAIPEAERDAFGSPATIDLLADVFRSLIVPVPYKRSVSNWGGYHLYPYVGQLVHYDAVHRKATKTRDEGPNVERYLYRGGGALAYDLLRRDPDDERRQRVDRLLSDLVNASTSPLGALADRVASHDAAPPKPPTVDGTVATDGHADRETRWSELLRSGVANILEIPEIPAKRVEHLMHWVPYCLARHQLELAHRELRYDLEPIVVDVAGIPALRRESRRAFDRHRRRVAEALQRRVETKIETGDSGVDESYLQDLLDGSQRWNAGVGDFYAATMAVIGGINHNTGSRHYTLKLPLLEAIVAARVPSGEGIPFADFCYGVLYEELGLVVDAPSGAGADVAQWVDNGDLRSNEAGLASLLTALGLMTALSDATRFVGGSTR